MQVQVCNKCGNKNTVLSGELAACNYCGSTDLGPITALSGGAATSTAGSSNAKWIILSAALFVNAAVAFWLLQDSESDVAPQSNHNTDNAHVAKNQTDSAPSSPTSPNTVPASKETPDTSVAKKASTNETADTDEKADKVIVVAATEDATNADVVEAIKEDEKSVQDVKPTAKVKPAKKVVKKVEVTKKVLPKVKEAKAPVKKVVEAAVVEKTVDEPVEKVAEKVRLKPLVLNKEKGVVVDANTGLMWMSCSVGQSWNGRSCSGSASELFWTEAMEAAEQSTYSGYTGWRLPTRQELNTIVSCSNGRLPYGLDSKGKMKVVDGVQQNGKCLGSHSQPTIDTAKFKGALPNLYWSYSHSAFNNYSAWGVFFNKGNQYSYNTSNLGFVRLVRNAR